MWVTTSFALKRIGAELVFFYEKTGTPPWEPVEHQGQLTPLQKQTIAYGQEYRNEKEREHIDQASSSQPSRPRNGMGRTSAVDKKKQAVAGQYGAANVSYKNADFDPDKPLIIEDN